MSDFYTLGIHDGHHAGAALLKNGEVIAAISEERLTAFKCQADTPFFALLTVLDIAGIEPERIDLVAVSSLMRVIGDWRVEKESLIFRLNMMLAPFLHGKLFNRLAVRLLHHLKPRADLLHALQAIGIRAQVPVVYVEHHIAHAATAYYQRPWSDTSLIFTLDGMGDGYSATVSIGEGPTMRRIATSTYYDSLTANVYAEITRYLGMKRGEHEYKVMGLAPYGDGRKTIDVFRSVMRFRPDNPLEFQNLRWGHMERLEPYYQKALQYQRFDHVAAGVQLFLEEMVVRWVQEAIRQTGIHVVCAAGGSFLNVKANMLLRQLPEVEKFFVYPAADDSGLPVGAALVGYVHYCIDHHLQPRLSPLGPIYHGQEYTDEQIVAFLKRKNLFRSARQISPDDIATLIDKGKILGRYSGRDEWGPRALGNRSIIADPRRLDIVTRLNRTVKQRDFWMPFAPAILEEDQHRYLASPEFSPYMTEAFETKKQTAAEIAATVHPADGTTRPMTVNDWNPSWRAIIRAFKKKTGVGAILNTSFNLHGYPMVSTPEQAIRTFQHSSLDGLVLNNWLLMK